MKKYIRNNETISGRLHDELVIMDIDKGKYFSMNPVATYIWDLLEAPIGLENLCLKLMEDYEVAADQCQTDTQVYLDDMLKLGLITVTEH
jgi:hypothetical protein